MTYVSLAPKGRASFETDGFVCDPGVLPREQIPELQMMAELGVDRIANAVGLPLEKVNELATAWGFQSTVVTEMLPIVTPLLRAAAEKVAEIHPEPIDATLFVKSPNARSATHAHQDIAYRWNRTREDRYGLTTWLALDDINMKMGGALSFLPGSHREKISVRQDFLATDFIDHALGDKWLRCGISMSAAAGDVILFDARTWHAASVYKGQFTRRALAVRWAYADQHEQRLEIPVPVKTPECFGMDTAGKLLIAALNQSFPNITVSNKAEDVADKIDMVLASCGDNNELIPLSVKQLLKNLMTALNLGTTHGARANSELWLNVRDRVIPILNCRTNNRSGFHG